MVRVFSDEEMKQMGLQRDTDLVAKYPNKYFLLVNSRHVYKQINGKNCICGVEGYLYATADYEDSKEYKQVLLDASNKYDWIAEFTSFRIKDGLYYVKQ